jgi:hypothetical protein
MECARKLASISAPMSHPTIVMPAMSAAARLQSKQIRSAITGILRYDVESRLPPGSSVMGLDGSSAIALDFSRPEFCGSPSTGADTLESFQRVGGNLPVMFEGRLFVHH